MKQCLRNLCKYCLVIAIIVMFTSLKPSSAYAMTTQSQALAWLESQVGKSIDYDGVYGCQCVDLIKAYYNYLGVSPVRGNGCDYATNSRPSGWTRVKGGVPQAGDILVYTGGTYGHVAICAGDNVAYHQNWGGQYVQRVTRPYNKSWTSTASGDAGTKSYWGYIRPNFTTKYYLDVNGILDNVSTTYISGYGTCDVYINGSRVANDVSDYWTAWPTGTKYEIKDIKAASGHSYIGYSGSLSGTIYGSTSVVLKYKTTGTKTISDGTYVIQSALNNSYILDVASDGNLVVNKANCGQRFKVTYLGSGYYKLTATDSGKVLDVYNGNTTNGTNVTQYSSHGGNNQQWIIKSAGNGYYYIISKCNGLYLDVYGGSAYAGCNVDVWDGSSGQSSVRWKFTALPAGTSLIKVTASSKAFTAKWKKQATYTTGYQIQYSTSSNFANAKRVTISSSSTVSKKITGLSAKKKYYVRVRTYRTISGVGYCSAWSSAKYVTTK